jgi:hypothetical protein
MTYTGCHIKERENSSKSVCFLFSAIVKICLIYRFIVCDFDQASSKMINKKSKEISEKI